jgi:hypothetical protein
VQNFRERNIYNSERSVNQEKIVTNVPIVPEKPQFRSGFQQRAEGKKTKRSCEARSVLARAVISLRIAAA